MSYIDKDPRKQGLTILGQAVASPELLKRATKDEAVVIGVGPSSEAMQRILVEMDFMGEIVTLY